MEPTSEFAFARRASRESTTVVVHDDHRDQYTAAIDNESKESKSDDDGDGDPERNNKQHMDQLPSDNTSVLATTFLQVLEEIVEFLSKAIEGIEVDKDGDDDDDAATADADDAAAAVDDDDEAADADDR
ncbi:hypothetical protein Dimus_007401 [Dionaea muscipula]